MTARESASKKTAGLCYAHTDDGVELPVLDVTHAAFSIKYSQDELAQLSTSSLRYLQRTARLPRFLLWMMTRGSVLARRSMAARGGFVDGMTTYLYKLGPDALCGKYTSRIDRRIVSQLSPFCVRLRLRAVAQQLADALAPALQKSAAPLCLVNIGGGVGADSFNALLLLHMTHAHLLLQREIRIVVLDVDKEGPRFGARAVAALTSKAGPLHCLNIDFEHIEHDWSNCEAFAQILSALSADSIVAVSSEGGLFEYGSDQDIGDNLRALRDCAAKVEVVVGSFAQRTPTTQAMLKVSRAAWRIYDVENFEQLATKSGWKTAYFGADNPIYHVVELHKA